MTRSMRIALALSALACLTAGSARATLNSFHGVARIELHERLVAGDPYAIDTTVVDLDVRIDGFESGAGSYGVGSATISSHASDVTVVLVANQMSPPAGGGGRVLATGFGDDGKGYCFDIRDLADAPTPRPDKIIAAFGPLEETSPDAQGSPPGIILPWTHCGPLLYLEDYVLDGDFAFTTTI